MARRKRNKSREVGFFVFYGDTFTVHVTKPLKAGTPPQKVYHNVSMSSIARLAGALEWGKWKYYHVRPSALGWSAYVQT